MDSQTKCTMPCALGARSYNARLLLAYTRFRLSDCRVLTTLQSEIKPRAGRGRERAILIHSIIKAAGFVARPNSQCRQLIGSKGRQQHLLQGESTHISPASASLCAAMAAAAAAAAAVYCWTSLGWATYRSAYCCRWNAARPLFTVQDRDVLPRIPINWEVLSRLRHSFKAANNPKLRSRHEVGLLCRWEKWGFLQLSYYYWPAYIWCRGAD